MNDNRNMLLAIVLSALVLLSWGLLSEKFFPTPKTPAAQVESGKAKPAPQPSAIPGAPAPQAIRERHVVLSETPRVGDHSISSPAMAAKS